MRHSNFPRYFLRMTNCSWRLFGLDRWRNIWLPQCVGGAEGLRVAKITRIARITYKFIHNALLVYQWGLRFCGFQIFRDFPTCENWLHVLHDRFSFQGRLVVYVRSRRISGLWKARWFRNRAVDWLDSVLFLILGSAESLESRINTFLRIFQIQKHCFQVLTFEFFWEKVR